MKLGRELIEEIKLRLKVSDVISKKVKLKPRGKEFVGLSPFSNEKTPSFTVSDEKGFFHCFSTGEHGSIFDFIMKTENLNFKDAVKRLAKEVGITVEDSFYQKKDSAKINKIKILKTILQEACKWYQDNLIRELKCNSSIRDLFIKRNFSSKIISDFYLGLAPKAKDSTYSFLRSKNFTTQDILDAGLIIVSERDGKKYDRFSNRVIFPIFDYYSNIVGFGGKAINTNQLAKYINSPSTLLYKKGDLLFGWEQCRKELKKISTLFIVEGYTDVISMYNIGFKNTLAPLGTALTEKQLFKCWQIFNEPTICMDGDVAGTKAAERISELILPHLKPGYSINFVKLPIDEDPDSLILSKKLIKLNNLLKNKVSLIDFLWNKLTFGKNYNTPEKKAALEEEIDSLVSKIKNFKVRKNYINFFKQKFFEKFSFKLNNNLKSENKLNLENKNIIDANKIIERVLIGSVILFPNLLNLINKKFFSINFETNSFNEIKSLILKLYNSKKTIENSYLRTKLLSSGYQEIIDKLIDKTIFVHAPFLKNLSNDFDKIVKGWSEYWEIYNKKAIFRELRKKADELLDDLNEENYSKLKNLQSTARKNYF
ncbi:MAG: DNA primase [Alphaproteobacteria bacterium MarineAlpha6_Bin2]|nr:MAG: DNA primase [Alphaproteobacteria bacterium MarineAlpha6_Bin2]